MVNKTEKAVKKKDRSTVSVEHSERIDINKTDIYPEDMIRRHVQRYTWANVLVQSRFGRAAWVLDAACGTGYGAKMLLSAAAKVVGLDIDPATVAHATANFGGGLLGFRVADFSKLLPVHSGQFDAAVTIETVEHLEDPGYFLTELHRALAPGGILLLSTPVRDDARGLTSPYHVREYTQNEAVELVTLAGFVDVAVDQVPELPGFIFLHARKPGVA